MKNIPLLFSICFIFLIGCNRIPADEIFIKFHIKNPDYKTFDVYYHTLTEQKHIQIPIQGDTVIVETLNYNKPMFCSFSSEDGYELYAEPGKKIIVTLDTADLKYDRVQYSGWNKDINDYLPQQ